MAVSIPDPWFSATTHNFTIDHGLARHTNRLNPAKDPFTVGRFILPPFQRDLVWTDEQSVKLIESLWMGLPIGSYCVNRHDREPFTCDDWLIDGQQRWTAILGYMADDFKVFGGHFSELTDSQRRRFTNKGFPCLTTRLTTEIQCREAYERLAYGGTPHATPTRNPR